MAMREQISILVRLQTIDSDIRKIEKRLGKVDGEMAALYKDEIHTLERDLEKQEQDSLDALFPGVRHAFAMLRGEGHPDEEARES